MSASLRYEEFAENLNTKFRVHFDATNTIEAELTEVSERQLAPQQEQFAVVFRVPIANVIGQGVRHFAHDRMGEFELFIVPIRQDAAGVYYEAIFNRLLKDE
jgi:hypothetical protein